MARKRSVKFGALNITAHPHDDEGKVYINLLQYLYKNRKPIPVRGNDCIYLSSLKNLNDLNPLEGLYGTFTKLTKIDADSWYNVTNDKPAEAVDVKQVNIPVNLYPNAKFFNFFFFPKKHILVSEIAANGDNVSISTLSKFFEILFERDDIVEKFKKVKVQVLPDMDKVEKIIQMEKIVLLELEVHRPNADDVDRVERSLMAKLNKLNAEKVEEKYEAQKKGYLQLDEITKDTMRVAAKNGKVEAKVIDDNGFRKKYSTDDIPFLEQDKYDPETESSWEFGLRKAREIYSRLTPK